MNNKENNYGFTSEEVKKWREDVKRKRKELFEDNEEYQKRKLSFNKKTNLNSDKPGL